MRGIIIITFIIRRRRHCRRRSDDRRRLGFVQRRKWLKIRAGPVPLRCFNRAQFMIR
ncbi:hypothetical protein HanIR_Chr14g0705671 [Helianthus annuus]|nr:hypothetical protein HanIR_Chr14g0705671 [Helianthus annuus]